VEATHEPRSSRREALAQFRVRTLHSAFEK